MEQDRLLQKLPGEQVIEALLNRLQLTVGQKQFDQISAHLLRKKKNAIYSNNYIHPKTKTYEAIKMENQSLNKKQKSHHLPY